MFYTEVLAWFTGILAIVSGVQGFFLYRADRTARTSADAAKLAAEAAQASAKALPNIERAYLFMNVSDWVCDADAHYTDGTMGSMKRIHGGRFYARYFLANHGKTPAVIHEIRIGAKRSADALAPNEWMMCPNILPRERVIAGSGGETPVYDIGEPPEPEWLSNEEADAVVAGTLFIYFYGCAIYSDVFGDSHETQFCLRFERTRLTQWGDREHNRRT